MAPNFRSKFFCNFYTKPTKFFLTKIWWALNNLVLCTRQCSRPNEEFVREYFTSHWRPFNLVYMEASHTQVKSGLKGSSSSCHHCTSWFHMFCTSYPQAVSCVHERWIRKSDAFHFSWKIFLVYKFTNLFFTKI